jgi:hypothetical protein
MMVCDLIVIFAFAFGFYRLLRRLLIAFINAEFHSEDDDYS